MNLPPLPDYLEPLGPFFLDDVGRPARVVRWRDDIWLVAVLAPGGDWVSQMKIGRAHKGSDEPRNDYVDAQRYRFLKERDPRMLCVTAYRVASEACSHEDPDAAIDAAIQFGE